jgi:hypothetical protein
MSRRLLLILAAGLALSGCASIVEGTTQQIMIETDPRGAQCVGTRQGERLFDVPEGQPVMVSKSRHAIVVECSAPGMTPRRVLVDSQITSMGAASIALDGGLTDYATGALNAYPSAVFVRLAPIPVGAANVH